jgi:hypothetical protein
MGLLDIFTGNSASQAANAARDTYRLAQGSIGNLADFGRNYTEPLLNQGYADARGELASGYGTAGNALTTGFEGARGDLSQGYGAAQGAINQGAGGALGYLDQGSQAALGRLDQARSGIGGAYAPLQALADQYGTGAGMYANSLGLGGAAGTQAAQQAFQAGPGYDFQLNQGLDAISRRRNMTGGPGGNVDRDAQVYGQGLANQEYGKWQDRLSPYNQYQLAATQGAATGTAGENAARGALDVTGANLLNQAGQNRAQITSAQGNNLADLANRYYGGQAALDTSQGGAMADLARQYYGAQAGLDTGQAGALTANAWNSINPQIAATGQFAGPTANAFLDEGKAKQQASQNIWNALGSAATLGSSTLGGRALSSLGSSLMSGLGSGAVSVVDPSMDGFSRAGQNAASVRF